MSDTPKRIALLGLIVCLILFASAPAFADEAKGQEKQADYVEKTMRKLGRGILNLATGPAELVRVPQLVTRKEGHLAGATIGLLQGAWRAVVRSSAGVYEIVTFYAPIPKDFRPLVEPEFVFIHQDWAE